MGGETYLNTLEMRDLHVTQREHQERELDELYEALEGWLRVCMNDS